MNLFDRLPWAWHDRFGRKNGVGPVPQSGVHDAPTGQCNRFSYCVSDSDGFVVAHCTNALISCSSERSEGNAKLFAATPEALQMLVRLTGWMRTHTSPVDGTEPMLTEAVSFLKRFLGDDALQSCDCKECNPD